MWANPTARPVGGKPAGLSLHRKWAVALAAVALIAGAVLLPRGDELMLIHVRNRDVERAQAMMGTDGASHTTNSIATHGELFELEGRVDKALKEAEDFAAAHPADVAAWTHLAKLYASAQRQDDWTKALATIYRLAPTEERARELASHYHRSGDAESEAAMLHNVIGFGHARADELVRSARLEATAKRFDRSHDAIEQLRRREPRAIDYPTMELLASVLIERKQVDQLAQTFQTLPLAMEDPSVLPTLATALTGWGHSDAALSLLRPVTGRTPLPEWLTAFAIQARGTKEARRAAATLVGIDAMRPLAADPLRELVALELSLSDYDAVEHILSAHAHDRQPAVVAAAIGHAVKNGQRARAQRFVSLAGDDGLTVSPMLALDLAIERADVPAADRWIAAIEAAGRPSPQDAAALAQFEVALGRHDRALTRLTALASTGRAPIWALGNLTTLAVVLHRQTEALAALTPVVADSVDARAAWARLAISMDRLDLVDSWFASGPPRSGEAQALKDVYYALSDRHESRLALSAARRLHEASDAVRDGSGRMGPVQQADAALIYDTALRDAYVAGLDVGGELKDVFAARLTTPSLPDTHRAMVVDGLWRVGERASIYDAILDMAARDLDTWLTPLTGSAKAKGDTTRAVTLVSSALRSTASDGRDPARRESLVRALLELDAPDDVVLPALDDLAHTVGNTWVFAYDERLAKRSQASRRLDLWWSVGTSPRSSVAERRAAAARLHDLGAPAKAAQVLEPLVASAGPADPDVVMLTSLWGPNATAAQRAWITARLKTASSAEQPLWMTHLVNAGGARDVLSVVPDLPASASPALAGAWLQAVRTAGPRRTYQSAIEKAVAADGLSDGALRIVGRAALGEGLYALAQRAFEGVIKRRSADLDAMRWLGAIAFYRGQHEDAELWLSTYEAGGGHEAEPLFQLGELALARDEDERARTFYSRALEQLSAGTATDVSPSLVATIYVRLGQRDRARAAFETLLSSPVTNGVAGGLDHVRADYASTLMQWGDDAGARRVLGLDQPPLRASIRPSKRGAPVRVRTAEASPNSTPAQASDLDRNGERRLDLLRVQWLSSHGRYADAERLLGSLGQRFPGDADVLVAQGAFDADRGRSAQAAANFEAARRQAPDREDIARLVDDRQRQEAPHFEVQRTDRSIEGGWEQQSTLASFQARLTDRVKAAVSFERLRLWPSRVLGLLGGPRVDQEPTRFEGSVSATVATDTTATATVYGTEGGLGAGASVRRDDLYGAWRVAVDRRRPYWDISESAGYDGRQDRVLIERQLRWGSTTSAWAQVGWNRYSFPFGLSQSSSGFGFGVSRVVWRRQPLLSLQYGLDLVRVRGSGADPRLADGGTAYIVPITNREVHLFAATTRFRMSPWDVNATAGYDIDRLGGRGPVFGFRLTPPASARVGLEVWGDWSLYSVVTTQRVRTAGVALRVGF